MKQGQYRSVRAAAIAAGIVKDRKRVSCYHDVDSLANMIKAKFDTDQIDKLISYFTIDMTQKIDQ